MHVGMLLGVLFVRERALTNSLDEFTVALVMGMDNISQRTIYKLVGQLPRRIEAVLSEAQGGNSRY